MRNSKKFAPQSKAALGRYLAAGLGAAGLASVDCEAAVVNIDVTTLGLTTGANGGIAANTLFQSSNFVVPGRTLNIDNRGPFTPPYGPYQGFASSSGVFIAAGYGIASPVKFLDGQTISQASFLPQFIKGPLQSSFYSGYNGPTSSVDFTASPANYVAFAVAANGTGPGFGDATSFHYGYFKTTWDSSSATFTVLSGAYESTPDTPIAVPEPSTIALTSIGALALGAGAIRRSRKARKAAVGGAAA